MRGTYFQFARVALCVLACLVVAACSSFEGFADRQQRHRRYTQALRALPERATRADIYAALPPLAMPTLPVYVSLTGVGALGTERYPLDADYQVAVPFLYARSRFIYDRSMPDVIISKPYRFTLSGQSPRDQIFAAKPSIEPRDTSPPFP